MTDEGLKQNIRAFCGLQKCRWWSRGCLLMMMLRLRNFLSRVQAPNPSTSRNPTCTVEVSRQTSFITFMHPWMMNYNLRTVANDALASDNIHCTSLTTPSATDKQFGNQTKLITDGD